MLERKFAAKFRALDLVDPDMIMIVENLGAISCIIIIQL